METTEEKKVNLKKEKLVKPEPISTNKVPDGVYTVKLSQPLEDTDAIEVVAKDGTKLIYGTVSLISENGSTLDIRVKVGIRQEDGSIKESRNWSALRGLSIEKYEQLGISTRNENGYTFQEFVVY